MSTPILSIEALALETVVRLGQFSLKSQRFFYFSKFSIGALAKYHSGTQFDQLKAYSSGTLKSVSTLAESMISSVASA